MAFGIPLRIGFWNYRSICGPASFTTGPSVFKLPIHLRAASQFGLQNDVSGTPQESSLGKDLLAQPAGRRHSSQLGHLEGCMGSAQGSALSKGLCLGTPAATRAMAKQISCQEGAVSAPSWHQDCVRTSSLAAALSAYSFAAEVLSCSASANRGQNTERATAPQCKPTFLRMAARWVCLSFPWGFLCFRTLWMLMHSCYKDLLLASMLPAPKKVKSQKNDCTTSQ